MAEAIRVWLEPHFDQGRTGAWLLDWPGAFTWGATRDIALGRATSAAHRFVDWLAAHGEQPTPVPLAQVDVVAEIPALRAQDGSEIRATFAPDLAPADASAVEAQLARLAYARADLLDLVELIDAFESGGGGLGGDGRSKGEVLAHLAAAETWFVSRLDPGARYEGPREPLDQYLAGAREFLIDGLRRIVSSDPTVDRLDGKGERWTLAKVLRRALYHALDHHDELDRRLALAERRADRVEIRHDAALRDWQELRRIFAAGGLVRRARDPADVLARTIANSTDVVTAWDGDTLVGFARLLSDETTNAYVSTVAVAPRWQDRGLGTRIMRELLAGREGLKIVLEAARGAERFYERLGFERAPNAFVRPRGLS